MVQKRHSILIVDDERENLNLLGHVLGDHHHLYKASGGEAALDLVDRHDIHMVLADHRMPGMTGVRLLEEIRKRKPDIVRILITAYPDIDVSLDAINRGQVRRFISKPYDPQELEHMVRQELEYGDLLRANQRLTRELGRMVEELLEANKELKELDKTKDYFLANVSHELKTPLVSGLGYVDLILEGKLGAVSPGMKKGLGIARRNLLRLLALIEDLLLLARMKYRPDAVHKAPFNLGVLIQECVDSLKARSRKSSLAVRVTIPGSLPAVEGDERRIHSVLTNVLSNAEKFTSERARIEIRVRRIPGNKVEVRITDNGMGPVGAKTVPFPFFKHSDDPQVKKFGGLGIGLTLARKILVAHGGSIELSSRPRGGANVIFDLPLVRTSRAK